MEALKNWKASEPVRLYLYGVLVPVLLLLAAKGVISDSDVALYSAVAVAALGVPVTEKVRSQVSPATEYEGDHRA